MNPIEAVYEEHIESMTPDEQLELVALIAHRLAAQPNKTIKATVKQKQRRSAVEILNETPGHRLFKTAAEVDIYLAQERAAWDS